MSTAIDWNIHLAVCEALERRATLRRRTHARTDDDFKTSSWWAPAGRNSRRDLKNGGSQVVNLIGDALPADI